MADSALKKANQVASLYSSGMGGPTPGRKPKAPVDDIPEINKEAAAQFQKGFHSSPILDKLKKMLGSN